MPVPQHSPETHTASIALADTSSVPHGPRRNTKSDGGSVGSNLGKLSIDDKSRLHQPASPPTTARTKRAAEPSGQVPDGVVSRPSKRHGKDQIDHNTNTDIAGPKDSTVFTVALEPGGMQATQALQSHAYNHAKSRPSFTNDNSNHVEPEGKMLLQPETRPITQDQLVNEVKGIYAYSRPSYWGLFLFAD